ncbi:MAG TPA: SPRY domain-containing protein [Kofleriaceae bacterium]
MRNPTHKRLFSGSLAALVVLLLQPACGVEDDSLAGLDAGALDDDEPQATAPVPMADLIDDTFVFAGTKLQRTVAVVNARLNTFPRSTNSAGAWVMVPTTDWTAGYVPGALWQMFLATRNTYYRSWGRWFTNQLANQANAITDTDVGLEMYDSFGKAFDLAPLSTDQARLLAAASTLSRRYIPSVRAIPSQGDATWTILPVKVDHLMDLELLFWAARTSGNHAYYDIAFNHALTSLTQHLRSNGSVVQMFDINRLTGVISRKYNIQGYSSTSTWARGQAWAIYGFTIAYRETRDARFLNGAIRAANYYLSRLPADQVPPWDFDAPGAPKDSSPAAITASALIELSQFCSAAQRQIYLSAADSILRSLMANYLAVLPSEMGILRHGVGHGPNHTEIDVSLIYGDYYFLEAMNRMRGVLTRPTPPTWDRAASGNLYMSFSADLLTATKNDGAATARSSAYANAHELSGKWYFEVAVTSLLSGTRLRVGLASLQGRVPNDVPTATYSYGYDQDGTRSTNIGVTYTNAPMGAPWALGRIIGVSIDLDEHWVEFSLNGVPQGRITGLAAGVSYSPLFFGSNESNGTVRANFGQSPFRYPPRLGFLPLARR